MNSLYKNLQSRFEVHKSFKVLKLCQLSCDQTCEKGKFGKDVYRYFGKKHPPTLFYSFLYGRLSLKHSLIQKPTDIYSEWALSDNQTTPNRFQRFFASRSNIDLDIYCVNYSSLYDWNFENRSSISTYEIASLHRRKRSNKIFYDWYHGNL